MNIILKAAARLKIPAERIDRARRAADAFEQLIRTHAGDRTSLEIMLADCSGEDLRAADLMHKRLAFRANSYIWGVQAAAQLKCVICQPAADDPDLLDLVTLSGYWQLRQMRRGVRVVVSRSRLCDDDGVVRRQFIREPLDPVAQGQHGIALLEAFCSKPMPTFRTVPAGGGFIHGEIVGGDIGHRAAVNCVEGDVARHVAGRWRNDHNKVFAACARVRMPCEVLLSDVMIREDAYGLVRPEVAVYGENSGDPPYPAPGREGDRLPFNEAAVHLGKGPEALQAAEVPEYVDMARYAFDRVGWDPERFDVYRCRIEFPVMPSTAVVRFELPPSPDGFGAAAPGR